MKRAIFKTLGCKLNQAETTQIAEIMRSAGVAEDVHNDVDAVDLIFVNTCAVTSKAAAKSRHLLSKMIRQYPNAIVIAAGCLAQMNAESLLAIRGVDYILGTASRFSTEWWIGKPDKPIVKIDNNVNHVRPAVEAGRPERSRPYLKIQDGCDQTCSYCIIPKLRGSNRSVERADALAMARSLIDSGAQEIVLTGVRIGSWGSDIGESGGLSSLVDELTRIPGSFRIRLGSIEPWEITDDLITLVTKNEKVCPHLHVPFQHTEARLLEMMGRPDPVNTIERLCSLKSDYSDMALGVDLITGFPGETEVEFNNLVTKIKEIPVSYLHVFGFSPRPGTPAARMPNQVHQHTIKERVARLINIGQGKRRELIASQANHIMTVIPDRSNKEDEWIPAVSDNYIKLHIKKSEVQIGRFLRVKMTLDSASFPVGFCV